MGARWTFGSHMPRAGSPTVAAYFRDYYDKVLLIAPDNLLLYAPLDGDTEDASGNDNTPSTESGGIIYPSYLVAPNGSQCVQLAEATTNYALNPSGEAADNWGALGDATVTPNDDTYALVGSKCIKVVTTAATNDGVSATLSTLSNAIHYVTVWMRGDSWPAAKQEWSLDGSNWNTPSELAQDDSWTLFGFQFPAAQANGSTTFRIRQTDAVARTVYLDCLQPEAKEHPTCFCDGSLGDSHSWSGTAHNSTSSRTATSLIYDADAAGISEAEGTFAAWVMLPFTPGDNTTNSEIFAWWDTNGTETIFLNVHTSGALRYYIYAGSTNQVSFQYDITSWKPFEWHHVVAVWKENDCRLYVDGVRVKHDTNCAMPTIASTDFTVGSRPPSVDFWLNGWLAHLAVWNRALDAAEIEYISAP